MRSFDTFISEDLKNLIQIYIFWNNYSFNWSVYSKLRFVLQFKFNHGKFFALIIFTTNCVVVNFTVIRAAPISAC